jgi:hypothetical protein
VFFYYLCSGKSNKQTIVKMKKIVNWLIAATLIVSGTSVLNSCSKANAASSSAPKVESTELIRTNKSWDGVDLPE